MNILAEKWFKCGKWKTRGEDPELFWKKRCFEY